MINIFQIGDVRLYSSLSRERDAASYKRKVKNSSKSKDSAWFPKKTFSFAGQSLSTDSFSISEFLMQSEYGTKSQRISEFISLMRKPIVDIIGFIRLDEIAELKFSQNFNYNSYNSGLFWLHNYGIVTEVDPSDENITINLDIEPMWQCLNRYEWVFQSTYSSAPNVITPDPVVKNNLSGLPTNVNHLAHWRWNKKIYDDTFYLLNDTVWHEWHKNHSIGYPTTGYGDGFSENRQFQFTVNPWEFSGITTSMYQWTNLPTSGSIEIVVHHGDNQWGQYRWNNTLNIEELNNQLLSYGLAPLQTTDKLFIADIGNKQSFLLRNNKILEDIVPVWTYTGDFLGATGAGHNRIEFVYTNPANIKQAHLHNFSVI